MNPMPGADRNAVVEAWCQSDLAGAVLPADRSVIHDSMTVRALIVDRVLSDGSCDELYDACAILGRILAQHGGSPTLASAIVDHLAEALDARDAPWVAPARGALAEGFASALVEAARRDAMQTWEYPSCVVPLGQASLAIAAGYPSEDDEALAAWAARVAKGAALHDVRRVVVAGNERACAVLVDALSLVGVEVKCVSKHVGVDAGRTPR
jgi:hypothetical protein